MVVGICLKSILNVILNDAKYHKCKTGINKCFVINNRDPVINFIKHNNMNVEQNKSIRTFDFETLYTSIPQSKVKRQIGIVIRSVFVLKKNKFDLSETEELNINNH